jgi:hypothetical protein
MLRKMMNLFPLRFTTNFKIFSHDGEEKHLKRLRGTKKDNLLDHFITEQLTKSEQVVLHATQNEPFLSTISQ